MQLTDEEKRKIFYALLEQYPSHERGRRQAKTFFHWSPEKLNKVIERINEEEKTSYALIKKFADEIGMEIPEYVEPK